MKNTIINNKIVNVQAYKHNGTLYRQWNGVKIISDDSSMTILFLYKTKVAEKRGQNWIMRDPVIWWHSKNDFYNTLATIKKDGIYFYTNLASPSIFEDNTIKFIDYDVDIKAYPGSPVRVVDKHEFKRHACKYKYDNGLIQKIKSTISFLLVEINKKRGIFNEKKINSLLEKLINNKDLSNKIIK